MVALVFALCAYASLDGDSDADGLSDAFELATYYLDGAQTDPHVADTDGDGINDGVEVTATAAAALLQQRRAAYTVATPIASNPTRQDTDNDGLSDAQEDENRNGRVDPGETSASRADSDGDGVGDRDDPTPHATSPEPMFYDFMRPLGAARGELEANVLVVGEGDEARWAAEVEYAFLPGAALEVELTFHGLHPGSVKAGAQATLPTPVPSRFMHGVQGIVEVSLRDAVKTKVSASYLSSLRIGAAGFFVSMLGAEIGERFTAVWNPSVFVRVISNVLTAGVESHLAWTPGQMPKLSLAPQLHIATASHVSVQLGAGVELVAGALQPFFGVRGIIELR